MTKDGQPSHITTENTMFCIPTIYESADEAGNLTLCTNKSRGGEALAHTIDGHEYQWLGLAVYMCTLKDGQLMSISGALPANSISLDECRLISKKIPVFNGHAMVLRYYQHKLWKELVFMAMGSFDSQRKIGQGGILSGKAVGTTDKLGPFVGSMDAIAHAPVKALIENPWGNIDYMLDDTAYSDLKIYAGQNLDPTSDIDNKEPICEIGISIGFCNEIHTDIKSWGMGISKDEGNNSTGLCDKYIIGVKYLKMPTVGGKYYDVSDGTVGVSYLSTQTNYGDGGVHIGARLAFVFDTE